MNHVYIFLTLMLIPVQTILFDFNKTTKTSGWSIVDDTVMGGRSQGNFGINQYGHAVFQGIVSTQNNGGFSSIRHRLDSMEMIGFSKIKIRLRGDGKAYQFRLKARRYDQHSYVYRFQTTGEWQVIEVPLHEMQPRYRGMDLNLDTYAGDEISEIAFLISNKVDEPFKLEIDIISVI